MLRIISTLLALFVVQANGRNFDEVEISAAHLSDSVYMLKGAGGNIGVSAGPDGLLIIDDQFAPLAEKIAAALSDINPAPPRYIVNTHYHGDHTGGNAWFHKHKQVTVFAHNSVRERLAEKDTHHHDALPVVTYEQGVSFHFNQETVRVMHLKPGHTDGDSVVLFENANVIHMGDLFFEGVFPYIDLKGGGSVQGYMDNVRWALDKIGPDTQVIPGHGNLTNKQGLTDFLNMIEKTSAFVAKEKAKGQSLEQMIEKGLDKKWKN